MGVQVLAHGIQPPVLIKVLVKVFLVKVIVAVSPVQMVQELQAVAVALELLGMRHLVVVAMVIQVMVALVLRLIFQEQLLYMQAVVAVALVGLTKALLVLVV
jgi:hypothetical protein